MRHLLTSLAFACALSLAACSEQATEPALDDGSAPVQAEATPDAATGSEPSDATASVSPDLPADSPVWFEPARLDGCEQGVAGVIHWDASRFPGVQVVRVALPGEDGEEGTFAVSGTIGEKETGPWLSAGSEVILRDNVTDKELARVRMPGVPCKE